MANAGLRRNSKVACSPYAGACDYGGACGKCKRVMSKQAARTRRNQSKALIRQELDDYMNEAV